MCPLRVIWLIQICEWASLTSLAQPREMLRLLEVSRLEKISISDFLEVYKKRPCRFWDLITNVFHVHFYKRIFASHFQVIHVIPIHVITEEVAWCFTRFICASVHELTEEQHATVRADILIIFIKNPIQILDT